MASIGDWGRPLECRHVLNFDVAASEREGVEEWRLEEEEEELLVNGKQLGAFRGNSIE